MSRVRVSDIGKELGIETKAILAQLTKMGVSVKNHLSTISDADAVKLRTVLKKSKSGGAKKTTSKIFIRRRAVETKSPEENPLKAKADLSAPSKIENDLAQEAVSKPTEEKNVPEDVVAASSNLVEATPAIDDKPSSEIHEAHVEEKVTSVDDVLQEQQPKADVSDNQKQDAKELSSEIIESKEPVSNEKEPVSLKDESPSVESVAKVVTETKSAFKASAQKIPVKETTEKGAPQKVSASEEVQSKPKTSFQSATIVRRAPENVYQVNMSNRSTRSSGDSYQGRSHRTGNDTHQAPRRPYGESRPGTPGGNRPGHGYSSHSAQTQKSFVMPDTTTPPGGAKDFSTRAEKGRGKERDKRRSEEDTRNNKLRANKGPRFYERNEFEEELNIGSNESGFSDTGINVRTMVSSKKRKPAFKRKDLRAESIAANPMKASKKIIRIDEHISVNDLAVEMSLKSSIIIKSLMKLGMLATANKVLDFDTATLVANEFGYETQNVTVSLEDIIGKDQNKRELETTQESRPPIITIMGHVDHGKTSLLDALRKTNVVSGEAGGITQHIGAYQINYQNSKLTFLDTPGHEAFTEMRARGAKVTDIVILVVAADDGVMPQTIEAIAHSKAAGVPIIVAINKIDKPNVNLDRLNSELAEQGVISEEWGGDAMFVKVSAKTGEGLDKLIEAILLQAEVLEIKAISAGYAEGVVIEAKRDKSRGPVATVIVTKGLLKQQDSIVVGKTMGRVRAMHNDKGAPIKEAAPGTPVEVIGLQDVPDAGDMFYAVASDSIAREAVAYKLEKHRQAQLASQKSTSLNDLQALFEQQEEIEKPTELNLIIKADTHGSVEAIKASLQKLDTPKVKNKVILASVGGITETDIVLADASHAIIIGFNVRPDKIASQRAESKGVQMMFFNIIYELIDAVKVSMAGTLAPVQQDKIIGHAEVRNLFTVPKVGVIAGCLVTDGKITRPCRLRVIRDGIVGYSGSLGSLKRFKDDAKEVMHGFECGIGVENYNDLKIGDVLEAFVIEEIAAEL